MNSIKINAILGMAWLVFLHSNSVRAASDSLSTAKPEFAASGFVDGCYAFDFNEPPKGKRLPFLYNHNRHNEFALNMAMFKGSVRHSNYRANLAFQTGTYPQENYAAEPDFFQYVYEMNAGFALFSKKNLWIDVGIFSSHIGFESALSKDNWTLTRSLAAENSPYYLNGGKVTWNPKPSWELALVVCNGWQRIKRVSGNSLPGFCSQIKYSRGEKFVFNWSTFVGTDDPDSLRRMRYFNNVYVQSKMTKAIGFIVGFDIGMQEKSKGSDRFQRWLAGVFIARYTLSEKWATALRAEYFGDEREIIVSTEVPFGFKTTGVSLNVDFSPIKYALFRVEAKKYLSPIPLFPKDGTWSRQNFSLAASMAVSF